MGTAALGRSVGRGSTAIASKPTTTGIIPNARVFTSATALLTSPFDSSSSIPTCPPYRLEIEPPRMVAILRELIGEDRCHSFSKRRQGGRSATPLRSVLSL